MVLKLTVGRGKKGEGGKKGPPPDRDQGLKGNSKGRRTEGSGGKEKN